MFFLGDSSFLTTVKYGFQVIRFTKHVNHMQKICKIFLLFFQDFKSEFRPRGRSFNYKHLRDPDTTEEERRLIHQQQQKNIIREDCVENEIETPQRKRKKNKNRNADSKGSNTSHKSHNDRNQNIGINSGDASEPVNV